MFFYLFIKCGLIAKQRKTIEEARSIKTTKNTFSKKYTHAELFYELLF